MEQRKNHFYTIFLYLLLGTILYFPHINNRNYAGILTVFYFLIVALLITDISFDQVSISIGLFIVVTLILDLITVFKTPFPITYVFRTIIYASIPLVSYFVGKVFSKFVNQKSFSKVLLIIGSVQCLTGLLQFSSTKFRQFSLKHYANYDKYIYSFENWSVGRIVGTMGNPNTYGTFMVMFSLFLLNIYGNNFIKKKYSTLIVFVLSVFSILLSQSRTAYLLLGLGILLSVDFNKKTFQWSMQGVVVLVIIIFLLKKDFILNRFNVTSLATLGFRTEIWKDFYETLIIPIHSNLFFGYGTYFIRSLNKAVDNYYLQLLLQYGLIGLTSYFMMVANILKYSARVHAHKVRNFLIVTYGVILISDISGTVGNHVSFTIILFILFGYYLNIGNHANNFECY